MSSYLMISEAPSSLMVKPLVKNMSAMVLAVVTTMGLFVLMYSLIKNEAVPEEGKPPISIPPLNYEPPTINNEFETIKAPIKPQLIIPPTEKLDFEPIEVTTQTGVSFPKTIIEKGNGNPVFSLDSDQVLPMVRVNPTYPQTAASRGIEGFVDVMFDVTETGSTQNVEVLYAEPEKIFNSAVIKAVSRWKYKPKMEDGTAIKMTGIRERIRFNLEK